MQSPGKNEKEVDMRVKDSHWKYFMYSDSLIEMTNPLKLKVGMFIKHFMELEGLINSDYETVFFFWCITI